MKCYFHPDREAVGGCYYCSRNLCIHCIGGEDPPICPGCKAKMKKKTKNKSMKKIVFSLGVFLVLVLIFVVLQSF